MPQNLLLIVSPAVKSELGIYGRKPWMAPGALIEIGAMVTHDWDVIAWDESTRGETPDSLMEAADFWAQTWITPQRYRAIDLADKAKSLGKQMIVGGRDIIGWSREEGGMDQIHQYFSSACTTTLSPDLMSEILIDAANKRLKSEYRLPLNEPIKMVLPNRNLIQPSRYFAGYTLRSSQGCKWNCNFCTVGGRGFTTKDPAILQCELNMIGWFFLDVADSFACDMDFIINTVLPMYRKSRKYWGTELNVRDALTIINGKTLIQHMAESGCRFIYMGFESVTRKLANNKCDRELDERAILECRRYGIVVVGALMLDIFGDETIEEIEETIVWASEWLDFAQFSLTAALPGCALRKKALAEGKILLPENWEKYDGAWSTLVHNLSPEVRRQLLHKAYVDFSSLNHVLARSWRAKGIINKIGLFYGGVRYHQGIPRL
jgi:hypothetical protein